VNNIPFVQIVKTLQNLPHKVLDQWFLEGTIAAQQGSHGATWHILQEDIKEIIIGGGIWAMDQETTKYICLKKRARTKVLNDIRMLEILKQVYLAFQRVKHVFLALFIRC